MAAAEARKPQTIDRHAFPRRPYLPAVPPPDAEALQPPDDDASGGGRRRACRSRHLSVRDPALCHQERTDELVSGGQRPLPLPDLPRRGHHPGHAVRQIHCARQHLRRGDPRALRHVEPQLAHRRTQLLDLGRRRRHDHRIRRIGRSRGPDRADRSRHRLEHRPPGPPQLQELHAAARRTPSNCGRSRCSSCSACSAD